jgi:hypothetical protein
MAQVILKNKLDQALTITYTSAGIVQQADIPARGTSSPLASTSLTSYTSGLIESGHLEQIPTGGN